MKSNIQFRIPQSGIAEEIFEIKDTAKEISWSFKLGWNQYFFSHDYWFLYWELVKANFSLYVYNETSTYDKELS